MKSTDEGVFIHRSPYSSNSLLTTFFTKDNGLQKFIFKGGKKKAHSLFPMSVSELSYYGRNKDLLSLTDVEQAFPITFQFDPVKSTIAYFIAEVVQKCVLGGDADQSIYFLLKKYAFELNENEEVHLFPLQFLIDFSNVLGFMPLRNDFTARVFNIDSGDFQHTMSQQLRTFKGPSIDLLIELIEKSQLKEWPTKENREEALKIFLNYYSIHVPKFKKLESYEILKEILND